jgi:ubiquitin-protein ligase
MDIVEILDSGDEGDASVPKSASKKKNGKQASPKAAGKRAAPKAAAGKKRAAADEDAEPEPKAPKIDEVPSVPETTSTAKEASPPKESTPPAPQAAQAAPKPETTMPDFDTTGKPPRWVKRMTGEWKKIFLQKEEIQGVKFELVGTPPNLGLWKFMLSFDPSTTIGKELAKKDAVQQTVDLEVEVPAEYPMSPPFVRVVYPKLRGGYIFEHGAICFEALTPKGWPAAMTLPALAQSLKAIFDSGESYIAGWGNKDKKTVPEYSYDGAKKDFGHILKAHNNGTSWSNIKLNS